MIDLIPPNFAFVLYGTALAIYRIDKPREIGTQNQKIGEIWGAAKLSERVLHFMGREVQGR